MGCLKNHYEQAFDCWLADNAVNYVYVDQHKRQSFSSERVKTFDYLIYPAKSASTGQSAGPIVIAELKGKIFRSSSLSFQQQVTTPSGPGSVWAGRLPYSG